MITIYGENGKIEICYDNENVRYIDINEFLDKELEHLIGLKTDIFVYNLSFWGLAIVRKLHGLGYEDITESGLTEGRKTEDKQFSYVCSRDNGAFYTIRAGEKCRFYEFLNLCSIDIRELTETFETETVSRSMHRCVLAVRGMGTRASTISSAAYAIWKKSYDRWDFGAFFKKPEEGYPINVRDAYFGGISYVKPSAQRRTIGLGGCVDCNSLYPFVMKNRRMPTGAAHYEVGEPSYVVRNSRSTTYFVHFRAAFTLKPDHMPFLKTRVDQYHWESEILEQSNYVDMNGNVFQYEQYVDTETGEILTRRLMVELVLYKADFELFFEQYDVHEIEYIDYLWYNTSKIFDKYVNKFYEMKKNAKNKGERRLAKMFQNALSGRMALKTKRKSIVFDERSYAMMDRYNGHIKTQRGKYTDHYIGESTLDYAGDVIDVEMDSDSFPQIGAAITSEARAYMVRKIQENWERFLYTDTDSIHFEGHPNNLVNITISEELGDFKYEHLYYKAIYYKPKMYVMYGDGVSKKDVCVTAAGIPEDVKSVLEQIFVYLEAPNGRLPEDVIILDNRVDKFIQNRFYKQMGVLPSTGHIDIPHIIKKWKSLSPARTYETVETCPIDIWGF